jgi:radical SAM protein with 4Fe4S-binding SPASM domain
MVFANLSILIYLTILPSVFNSYAMFLAKIPLIYFYKIANLCKAVISYAVWCITKVQIMRFSPWCVSIEPLNSCNLHCPECPVGNRSLTRENARMEWPLFQKAVDEIALSAFGVTLYFQGEPYLHPYFTEMIAYCHKKRLYTYTSTNAQLITDEVARKTVESGLDKIVISADGLTQGIYQTYRQGGDLQKVRKAIGYLACWKKQLNRSTPVIEFQFIVTRHNESELADVRKTALAWGADRVSLKTAQIDFDRIDQWIPQNGKYARYVKNADGVWQRKKKLRNRCWRQWRSAVIAANGDILPCCFDKNGEHVFGNIRNNSLFEVWNGENGRKFRTLLRKSRKVIAICNNCSE